MNRWLPVVAAAIAAALLLAVAMVLLIEERDEDDETVDEGPADEGPADEDGVDEDAPEEGPVERPPGDDQGSIVVTLAWIDEGDCLFEEDPANQSCHRLRVTVNAPEEDPFDVSIATWQAVDEEGGMHTASWVVSPDEVQAGASRSIVVSFDLEPEVRLVTLHYEDGQGRVLSAGIPEYEEG